MLAHWRHALRPLQCHRFASPPKGEIHSRDKEVLQKSLIRLNKISDLAVELEILLLSTTTHKGPPVSGPFHFGPHGWQARTMRPRRNPNDRRTTVNLFAVGREVGSPIPKALAGHLSSQTLTRGRSADLTRMSASGFAAVAAFGPSRSDDGFAPHSRLRAEPTARSLRCSACCRVTNRA